MSETESVFSTDMQAIGESEFIIDGDTPLDAIHREGVCERVGRECVVGGWEVVGGGVVGGGRDGGGDEGIEGLIGDEVGCVVVLRWRGGWGWLLTFSVG